MVAVRQLVDETVFRYRTEGAEQATAAADKLAQKTDEVTASTERQERRAISVQKALEKFAASNDAAFRAQQQVERAQALVNRAFEQGLAGTRAFERATAALAEKQALLARVTAQAAAANDNAAAKARAGWSALSAQGAAQEKVIQANERLAAGWRSLSAQGASQARVIEGVRAANDNAASAFAAQAGQIGALLPGYGTLITLVGGLGAAYAGAKFVETVTSFQAIDASLKAATGSTEGAQSTLAFVRAESDRLGLSLGSTAKSFASFAASTRGTELEGEKTRKVFSSIAEAGTVLGLSADNMSGALYALSQMASKGTVQAEELRGQLGERLPGAFNIAAKAMGVTTAELGKMLEQGQVLASDFLPKFADEMHRVFGPEAANASKNLQANLNRLQTAILDLFLAAGKGGLTEALNDAVRQAAAFLRSSQDVAFSAGGALATGLRTAGAAFQFVRENSDLAAAALAALLALRFGPAVIEIAAGAARAAAMMGVYDVATRQLVVSQTAAVASSRALSLAMGVFGGPIGLALTALAAGATYLALRQDEGAKAAQAQAASIKTLDAALVASKGSLASAADETKRLAAEQMTAAQAGVVAAQARLKIAEAEQARVRAQAGGGGVDAFYYEGLNTAVADREAARATDNLSVAKERLAAVLRLLAGAATDADRALLGLPPTVAAGAAAVEAAIPSVQKYSEALSRLIAMVPELAKAVEAQGKLTQARTAFDEGTLNAQRAYLQGKISQNEMVDVVTKVRETYERATSVVSGFEDAQAKVDARLRSASIGAMEAQAGEIAKLRDGHDAYVKSLNENEKASLTSAQRNDLVTKSEQALAQEIANVNSKYAEREAKKAGSAATKEAGKAAREAAREFDGFEKQADAAFKKLFPEDALRKKGEELQALLDKYEDRLAKIDPRLVDSIKTTIKLNLDGKEVEGVKHRTDELATEMSQTFRGVFDEMFSAGNKGFDGLLNSFTRSISRIGSRLLEQNFLAPLFGGKEGSGAGAGGGLNLFGGFDFDKIEKAVGEGSFSGIMESFGDLLKPGAGGGKGTGFASTKLGGGLMAAGVGASIGYQSQSPLMGIAGGALAGASFGPWGAVIGAGAGLIGGLLGKDQAKKAAAKKLREQLEAYKEVYKQAEPEIKKLEATFRGESVGNVGGQIDAAFQQAVAANKTASQAGDQKRADAIMVDFTKYAFRLRDQFMAAFEGTLSEVAAGFGTSGPFAQANAAVATLGESLKAFVKDSESLPEAASNTARARAAAQQAALAALDPPKALSDTQSRLAAIQGTAAGLSRVLQDLGMSADEAAAAIRDRTAKAMDALRAQFSADLGAKINDAAGKSYLNDIADLVKERDGLLADARAIGADTAQVGRYFTLAAQKVVDGSELTGAAFTDLVKRFPALKGAVVEFGQAIDTAAAKAEAAARALGYQDRSFAAGNDTSTLAGALAAQDRKAAQDRAAEAKAGGRAMADLEKALAAERTAIIKDFAARAADAEATAREAGARRVLSAEDRLFAARNDASTLDGKLAEMERQHAQERVDELAAGGQALAKLEQAQAAERLKVIREAGAAEVAARKQALAEAQTFLDGATKGIRTYLDGLKTGADTALSPGDRLAEAQKQFDAQAALAHSGNRDAMGSITTYASNLLDAGRANFASGQGYQSILAAVQQSLGDLPSQVSAEQFIVDAITKSTTDLGTAIAANNPAAIATALNANFSKLDTSLDGKLSVTEFAAGLGPLATSAEQAAARAIFDRIDQNGDGLIDAQERARFDLVAAIEANSPDLIQKALSSEFDKIDTDGSGGLTESEFLAGIGPLATAAEQAAARAYFKAIDEDGNGVIDRIELMRGQLKTAVEANSPGAIEAALRSNFDKIDTTANGLLDKSELVASLGPLATAQQQADALAVFKRIDTNGDGQISKQELIRAQLKAAIEANSPALIQKALALDFAKLDALDANTKGSLTIAEFKAGLGPLATKAEQDAAELLFQSMDENSDGLLSKTELMRGQLKTAIEANTPAAIATALNANFTKLDTTMNGRLDKTEFLSGLGSLATKEQADAAKKVFDAIDKDGDGQITKLDAVLYELKTNLGSPTAIATALNANFDKLDKTSDKALDLAEFTAAIGSLATKADQQAAKLVFDSIDRNGNGLIDKIELTRSDLETAIKANSASAIATALNANFDTLASKTSGGITKAQFDASISGLSTKAEQSAARAIFKNIDADGNGIISKTEAVRAELLGQLKLNDPSKIASALNANFSTLTAATNGRLTSAQLIAGLGPLATKAEQSAAREIFKSIDADGNNIITKLEAVSGAIVGAVKANNATAFAAEIDKSFTDLDARVDGLLDQKELAAAISGLSTNAEIQKANAWLKLMDTDNDGMLSKTEVIRARMVDTTKNTSDTKTAVDGTKTAVGTGNTLATDMKALLKTINDYTGLSKTSLDLIKDYSEGQKIFLGSINAFQKTADRNLSLAKDSLDTLKTSSGTQESTLKALEGQFSLKDPLTINGFKMQSNMVEALNKIVFNTANTVIGLKSGASYTYATGGWVNGPGTGTSDSISARLSNGEFVVNAASARMNAGLLEAMNDNRALTMPAMAVPVPVATGGGDVVAELRALRAEVARLRAENKAGQEMQARVTKAGSDRVAAAAEGVREEAAGHRDDDRRRERKSVGVAGGRGAQAS